MNIREKLIDLAAWLEGNERARKIIAILQIVAAACATLYKLHPQLSDSYAYIFVVAMSLLLISSVFSLLFYRRRGLNMLVYNKNNGLLYDQGLEIPNVALRKGTVEKLLGKIEAAAGEQALREIGVEIGKDFTRSFRDQRRIKRVRVESNEFLLNYMLEYDSSSGMGKYEIIRKSAPEEKRWFDIKTTNPFTELKPFLAGYLSGVVSEVFGNQFNVTSLQKRPSAVDTIFDARVQEA
jgi:hypothetical protein